MHKNHHKNGNNSRKGYHMKKQFFLLAAKPPGYFYAGWLVVLSKADPCCGKCRRHERTYSHGMVKWWKMMRVVTQPHRNTIFHYWHFQMKLTPMLVKGELDTLHCLQTPAAKPLLRTEFERIGNQYTASLDCGRWGHRAVLYWFERKTIYASERFFLQSEWLNYILEENDRIREVRCIIEWKNMNTWWMRQHWLPEILLPSLCCLSFLYNTAQMCRMKPRTYWIWKGKWSVP